MNFSSGNIGVISLYVVATITYICYFAPFNITATAMKIRSIFLLVLILSALSFYFYKRNAKVEPIVSDPKLLRAVTIVTTSFDDNNEIWEPHYKLLFKNWPSLKSENSFIPVMLVSNELAYNDPRVISLKIGPDITWSANLLKALEFVKTKYVLIMMDDYILNAPVNEERLVELITLLEKTDGAYIEIHQDDDMLTYGMEKERKYVQGINDVLYRSKNSTYRNSLQACIWNTDELRKLIDITESAWAFEIVGNERTKKNPKPFYMVTANPAMTYLNAMAKKVYEEDVVDYINSQGVHFTPSKPVKNKEEMKIYLKTDEANKVMKLDEASGTQK